MGLLDIFRRKTKYDRAVQQKHLNRKFYCLYCGKECKQVGSNLYLCLQSYTLWKVNAGFFYDTFHAFYLKDVKVRSIEYCPYCGHKSVWNSGSWCSNCGVDFSVEEHLRGDNRWSFLKDDEIREVCLRELDNKTLEYLRENLFPFRKED